MTTGLETLAGLARMAASLEQRGDWEGAARAFSAQFRMATAERAEAELVSAVRGGARVRHRQGRHDEAEELALLSEEVSRALGMDQAAARALNVRALIRYSRGDLQGAEALYRESLEQARRVRDDELVGLVCQNLGVIANIRGDLLEARALYLECMAASLRSGDRAASVGAYANLGAVCSDLRDWLESELYFDRAIEEAERLGLMPELARLQVARAEPLLQMRELSRARATLDEAARILEVLDDRDLGVSMGRFRGVLARMEGDYEAAGEHLARALAQAREGGNGEDEAEVLAEMARLFWARGFPADARATAEGARQRFRALGASREVEEMERLLAGWGGGDPA